LSDKFQRDLLRGSLDLMVLSVLAGGNKYGYLIQKEVREASGSRVDLKAGTLYPLLHKLEDERLVRSTWDSATGRQRKWYELTSAGRRRLTAQAQEWTDYAACIQQLLAVAQVKSALG
jgi:DNA-binding PadR family transcriptional regulator